LIDVEVADGRRPHRGGRDGEDATAATQIDNAPAGPCG
jgi:hypothetical protein